MTTGERCTHENHWPRWLTLLYGALCYLVGMIVGVWVW